jgi:hypothetical protein
MSQDEVGQEKSASPNLENEFNLDFRQQMAILILID